MTAMDRFVEKLLVMPDGCWQWTGATCNGGYGHFKIAGRGTKAHRFAYEQFIGPIPDGLQTDHLCCNPLCVNPGHLEPVTSRENTLRGTSFAAGNAHKTHCHRGHPFDEENTQWRLKGGRACRHCKRIANRAWYARAQKASK